jgi:hypothetical protein
MAPKPASAFSLPSLKSLLSLFLPDKFTPVPLTDQQYTPEFQEATP